jgi:DNA-binding winged helix-turn-helix (wHTH) protein/tetratricopeptide (TPR) repeat protein
MTADLLVLQGCEVDLAERLVRRQDGETHPLTDKEVGLLSYMAARPGETIAAEELEREVWGYAEATVSRAVSAAVRRLRRKIEPPSGRPVNLRTVFGVGWRLDIVEAAAREPVPAGDGAVPSPPGDAFVGREAVLVELADIFRAGARLVTLVGPGGVGKTRLALEAARRGGILPGSARFCGLLDHSDEERWIACVARAVGIPLSGPDLGERLVSAMAAEEDLTLVLDNAEDGLEAARALIPRWLDGLPSLRLLLTSRTPLGQRGEHLVVVEPLAVDGGGEVPAALELLLARARERGIDLTDGAELRALVQAVSGLPLALELAASRLGAVDPGTLLARLHEPDMLRSDEADRPERHRSLSATVRPLWDELGPGERQVLAALSACEAPTPVDALVDLLDVEAPVVYDAVQALRERGVVQQLPGGRIRVLPHVGGLVRHWQPVGEAFLVRRARWVFDHLEAHPAEQESLVLAARHLDEPASAVRATVLAADALEEGGAPRRALWLVRETQKRLDSTAEPLVVRELDLLVSLGLQDEALALGEGVLPQVEDVDVRTRMGLALGMAHLHRMDAQAAVGVLEATLHRGASPSLWARHGRMRGMALMDLARPDEARDALAEALTDAVRARDPLERAWVLVTLSSRFGDVASMGESLEALRELDLERALPRDRAALIQNLAIAAWNVGRGAMARRLSEQAVQVAHNVGVVRSEAISLGILGMVLVDQGHFPEAASALDEATSLNRSPAQEPYLGLLQGRLALHRGRPIQAGAEIDVALEAVSSGARPLLRSWLLEHRAEVDLALGRVEEALVHARAAAEASAGARLERERATSLATLARVAHHAGEEEASAAALAEAVRISEGTGLPFDRLVVGLVRAEAAAVPDPAMLQALTDWADGLDLQATSWLRRRLGALKAPAPAR